MDSSLPRAPGFIIDIAVPLGLAIVSRDALDVV
jgi:hypothetical protein